MAHARLSDETVERIREAQSAATRARKALRLAEELHSLAVERYNATVRGAGFDPATFRLYPDGTATDGHPSRQG